MTRRKTEAPKPPEPWREVVETFGHPAYELNQMRRGHDKPSCFNGTVSVRKYRVTAELIDEPIEVIRARIIGLWESRACGHHQTEPLRREAARYGLTLDPNRRGITGRAGV